MKHGIIYWIFFLLLACSWTACNDKLNVLPSSSQVDGNIISDSKSAAAALNGVYYNFANSGNGDNHVPAVLWTQLFQNISSELSGLVVYPYGADNYADHTYTPTTGVDGIWNYGYKLVNTANGFIKNIDPVKKLDNTSKQQMIAEARFLRAFGNSTLLLYYGQYDDVTSKYGIILRNSFINSDDINQPRVGVGQTYDSIIADLDVAIADLPDQNTTKYYANKWVGKLLKARVLINRGLPEDYKTVISLTTDIIANSPYSLEPNVKDIFLSKAFQSSDVMMGVQPYPNQTVGYYNNISYTSLVSEIATDTLVNLFKNDPRNQWMLKEVMDDYYQTTEHIITKYYPGSTVDIPLDPITENAYAFRLTEAYLLESEALVKSGGDLTQAKMLLKTVMSHAGFTDLSAVDNENSPAGLLKLILLEEMKSFVAEAGQDWLAVRRLPLATLQQLIPGIKKKSQLILPIPQTEMSANAQMIQNPEY